MCVGGGALKLLSGRSVEPPHFVILVGFLTDLGSLTRVDKQYLPSHPIIVPGLVHGNRALTQDFMCMQQHFVH